MPKKTVTPTPPPFKPLRVSRVMIVCEISRYDEQGHLLGVKGLTEPVAEVLFPYPVSSEQLQQIATAVEDQVNRNG